MAYCTDTEVLIAGCSPLGLTPGIDLAAYHGRGRYGREPASARCAASAPAQWRNSAPCAMPVYRPTTTMTSFFVACSSRNSR
jgi:hypothetical protein